MSVSSIRYARLRLREARLTDAERAKRFKAAWKDVIENANAMSESAQAETLRLMLGVNEELTGILAKGGLSGFQQKSVKDAVDNANAAVVRFAGTYGKDLDEIEAQGWKLAADGTDKAFAAAGVEVRLPMIATSQLEAIRALNAQAVKGVSDAIRSLMTRQLVLLQLGTINTEDAIDAVTALLAKTPRAKDPLFGGIAQRARGIVRTEVMTAQEAAAHARREQWIRAGVEGLEKGWSGCRFRPGHLPLNGTSVEAEERFVLVGKDTNIYRPLFPRDPDALPVGERVNCSGRTTVTKESWKEFSE